MYLLENRRAFLAAAITWSSFGRILSAQTKDNDPVYEPGKGRQTPQINPLRGTRLLAIF